ncbi:uncharacterized protein LOC135847159 [Planococcus citri]|uniref:uncharacterized protein LOC135847159 n=1 Tax=Planococcus citri TaxID=170843 RepID=UPI0031F9F83E
MTSVYSPQLFSKLSSEWYLATALYDAIDDGNLREVSILLRDKHADPNVIIPDYDITPFHLAVGHENELFAKEVTKLLLKNGADPNVKDNEGVTPLHVAAVWNRPTIVRILLTYGGDPSITDDTEKNAFHYAYEEHAWETLKTLEIHRRAELKKSEITDKSYNIQLDKVIVQGDGIQAEYRPLCEGCKKDIAVEKQSVATQTSPPSVNLKDKNTVVDPDPSDLENISSVKIRPKYYDWCEQACGVMLTDECKRKITSHRAKGRVYEYNPIFENRYDEKTVVNQHFTKFSICCSAVSRHHSASDETSPDKETIEMKTSVKESSTTKEPNGNGDFSEDSLNSSDRKAKESFFDTLNVPFIDESATGSSQNGDTKVTPESNAKNNTKSNAIPAVPDSSVPDQQIKEKHVSWSGCLSTCSCIPKRLNDSDSSVYFTNAESDAEDKSKIDLSKELSGIQKLSLESEQNTAPSKTLESTKEISPRDRKSVGDTLISNDETAPLTYEDNSLISNDGVPANYYTQARDKQPLKFAVEYKYTDDEDGIEFVEARLPLCISSSNSNSNASTPLKEKTSQNEQRARNSHRIEDLETSDSAAYDTDYIRTELKKLGFTPGPMAGETKKLYLKKLRRIRKCTPEFEPPPMKPIFSSELEHVLREDNDNWEKIITKWSVLETEIQNHFADNSFSSSWRSGTAKTSFTYLLLDPRISDNLPARCEQMDLGDVWRDFVHAIFYVGKGTAARPYEHLHEAFLVWKETKAYPRKRCNLKVRHILDIWKEGLGVVCLQVFHNIIPADAYTREAAMIDAIGVSRLKNEKAGMYYGIAASWNSKLKRRLGTYLLYRAMRMFIADNEVQLKPTDVR